VIRVSVGLGCLQFRVRHQFSAHPSFVACLLPLLTSASPFHFLSLLRCESTLLSCWALFLVVRFPTFPLSPTRNDVTDALLSKSQLLGSLHGEGNFFVFVFSFLTPMLLGEGVTAADRVVWILWPRPLLGGPPVPDPHPRYFFDIFLLRFSLA